MIFSAVVLDGNGPEDDDDGVEDLGEEDEGDENELVVLDPSHVSL